MNFRMNCKTSKHVLLAAVVAGSVPFLVTVNRSHAATYNWLGNTPYAGGPTGNWNTVGAAGWDGGPPNSVGDVAQRVTPLTDYVWISQSASDVTIGSVKFGNGTDIGAYWFEIDPAAGRVLNLNNNGAGATIEYNNTNTANTTQLWFGGAGSMNLADNLRINVVPNLTGSTAAGGTIAFAVPITGTGNVTINSNQAIPDFSLSAIGQVQPAVGFRAASTYVGTTTIEKGAVQFIASGAFGDSANTIQLGLAGANSAALEGTSGSGALTIANPIVVAGNNTGTLTIANPSSNTSGSVTYSAAVTLNGNVNIVNNSKSENQVFLGNISGPGGIFFPSSLNNGQTSFRGNNSYTGDTTINGQTLTIRSGNGIPNGPGTGVLTVNGTLLLGSTGETINGLNGTGTVSVVSSAKTLTVGDNDADGLFSGAVAGGISIVKTGNGTQTFSGANTYTGPTTVNQGTVMVSGTHTGGDVYTVASGATLGGAGGNIGSNVMILPSGNLAPGDTGVGTLTVASSQMFTGSQLTIKYDGAAQSISMLNVTGSLDITGAILNLQNLSATALAGGALPFATYGSLTGTFDSTLNLPAGFSLDYNYQGSNEIALVSIPPQTPGDFNGDGLVNGADFSVWQGSFPTTAGANLAGGDADGDGDVDGADFIVWQTHYSPGGGASPATSAVPEPTGISLLAIAALVGCAWLRTREKAIRLPT